MGGGTPFWPSGRYIDTSGRVHAPFSSKTLPARTGWSKSDHRASVADDYRIDTEADGGAGVCPLLLTQCSSSAPSLTDNSLALL